MAYIKARDLLPPELVREIQKYIQGTQIYIPRKRKKRLGWGRKNGARQKINQRNAAIRDLKKSGWSIAELAEQYHLSADSIRKIVY